MQFVWRWNGGTISTKLDGICRMTSVACWPNTAWLVVSDSGGMQEEVPSLGKAMLILRDNAERPEAVECGVARLVGGPPEHLAGVLDEIAAEDSWLQSVKQMENPFGCGDAARRTGDAIGEFLRRGDISTRLDDRVVVS